MKKLLTIIAFALTLASTPAVHSAAAPSTVTSARVAIAVERAAKILKPRSAGWNTYYIGVVSGYRTWCNYTPYWDSWSVGHRCDVAHQEYTLCVGTYTRARKFRHVSTFKPYGQATYLTAIHDTFLVGQYWTDYNC